MIRLILEVACAIIILALSILLFIHVLPWIVIVLGVLALGALLHYWSSGGKGFGPIPGWPWWRCGKEENGGQPTP